LPSVNDKPTEKKGTKSKNANENASHTHKNKSSEKSSKSSTKISSDSKNKKAKETTKSSNAQKNKSTHPSSKSSTSGNNSSQKNSPKNPPEKKASVQSKKSAPSSTKPSGSTKKSTTPNKSSNISAKSSPSGNKDSGKSVKALSPSGSKSSVSPKKSSTSAPSQPEKKQSNSTKASSNKKTSSSSGKPSSSSSKNKSKENSSASSSKNKSSSTTHKKSPSSSASSGNKNSNASKKSSSSSEKNVKSLENKTLNPLGKRIENKQKRSSEKPSSKIFSGQNPSSSYSQCDGYSCSSSSDLKSSTINLNPISSSLPENILLGFNNFSFKSNAIMFLVYLKVSNYNKIMNLSGMININYRKNSKQIEKENKNLICNIKNRKNYLYVFSCTANTARNVSEIKVALESMKLDGNILDSTPLAVYTKEQIQNKTLSKLIDSFLLHSSNILVMDNCEIINQKENITIQGNINSKNIIGNNSYMLLSTNDEIKNIYCNFEIKSKNEYKYNLILKLNDSLKGNLNRAIVKINNNINLILNFRGNDEINYILDKSNKYSTFNNWFDLSSGANVNLIIHISPIILVFFGLLLFVRKKPKKKSEPLEKNYINIGT